MTIEELDKYLLEIFKEEREEEAWMNVVVECAKCEKVYVSLNENPSRCPSCNNLNT